MWLLETLNDIFQWYDNPKTGIFMNITFSMHYKFHEYYIFNALQVLC